MSGYSPREQLHNVTIVSPSQCNSPIESFSPLESRSPSETGRLIRDNEVTKVIDVQQEFSQNDREDIPYETVEEDAQSQISMDEIEMFRTDSFLDTQSLDFTTSPLPTNGFHQLLCDISFESAPLDPRMLCFDNAINMQFSFSEEMNDNAEQENSNGDIEVDGDANESFEIVPDKDDDKVVVVISESEGRSMAVVWKHESDIDGTQNNILPTVLVSNHFIDELEVEEDKRRIVASSNETQTGNPNLDTFVDSSSNEDDGFMSLDKPVEELNSTSGALTYIVSNSIELIDNHVNNISFDDDNDDDDEEEEEEEEAVNTFLARVPQENGTLGVIPIVEDDTNEKELLAESDDICMHFIAKECDASSSMDDDHIQQEKDTSSILSDEKSKSDFDIDFGDGINVEPLTLLKMSKYLAEARFIVDKCDGDEILFDRLLINAKNDGIPLEYLEKSLNSHTQGFQHNDDLTQ